VQLSSRLYAIPEGLTSFDDSFFRTVPRSAIEYLLSVGAQVQYEMVNGNIVLPNGNFNQVLLRDAGFQGMYSLWYTTPVSFGVGDYGFQDPIQYSSFLHEMGHNFTLNFPANYCYGGKIDGWANAIFSESMAQIFAHAAAFEIINQQGAYGLADDVVSELKSSARDSIRWVRRSYENYYEGGKRFHSWNDPSTPQDETFDTFMTIARQFFAHAEWAGEGYKAPTQRMMHLLALFNPELQQRYSQGANSPAAESFRASLLVAALSHAFSTDLRVEFRELGFPVDDAVYQQLLGMVQ